jgi:hypothetical protein
VAHCVRTIQELVGLGIRFLSPTETIDTGTESPMSRFLLHLFAALAEMEREIIRDRVRAGVRAAKARGVNLGRHGGSSHAMKRFGCAHRAEAGGVSPRPWPSPCRRSLTRAVRKTFPQPSADLALSTLVFGKHVFSEHHVDQRNVTFCAGVAKPRGGKASAFDQSVETASSGLSSSAPFLDGMRRLSLEWMR